MLFDRRTVLQAGLGLASASALGLGFNSEVFAKAPLATAPTPYFYRFKVGTIEVTAIADGIIDLPLSLFSNIDAVEAKALLEKAHRPEAAPTSINCYAINTGDQLILVDTGLGALGGPDGGQLLPALKAAGYTPDQVDAVMMTHLHFDHFGGLLDSQGQPVFKNATLLISDKEYDFWTDDSIKSRAPGDIQKFFTMAQAALKPYEKNVQKLRDGEAIGSGINAFQAIGHTPGHTTVRLASGKDSLLIWGDTLHVAALQFAKPDFQFAYDNDKEQAVVSRKRLLDQVSADRTLIAGMHLDFPGIGHVNREAQGYSFHKAVWSTKL